MSTGYDLEIAMAMTQEDRDFITECVQAAIRSAGCGCHLSPDAQAEVQHFFGYIKDTGGGDYGRGVEVLRRTTDFGLEMQSIFSGDEMREDMRFVRRWRKACERTGGIILGVMVLAGLGLLGAIGSAGWWSWIRGGGNLP